MKLTANDWKQHGDSFFDPYGWRITKSTLSVLHADRLMLLVELGGAAFTSAYGPLIGLSPPPRKDAVQVLIESSQKQKAKAAPPDDQLYRFFATVTAPGCCPKCSAPCPCAYHSDARPVR